MAIDGRELARQQRLLAAGRERLAQLAADEREVLVHLLDAAELSDELDGGLLADALHAGDVVDAVAHQREHVGDLRGLDTPTLADLRLVVDDLLAGAAEHRQHPDTRADKLQQILVAGDDDDLQIGKLERLLHDRGEHVVRLVAPHFEHGRAERVEQAAHVRELAHEVVRHRGARRLVLREQRVAERRARRIERDAEVVGLLFADQLPQHRAEDEHRVTRHALRRREVADRVVRAEDVRMPVDDVKTLHAMTCS